MTYSDEYKTSLSDLEALRSSGAISWAEYVELKKGLEADKNYKQTVFDSNQDGLITDYEEDLYNEFNADAAARSDINIQQKYQDDQQEIRNMYNQGIINYNEYKELLQKIQQEYNSNYQLDTNHDGILSGQEAVIGNFKEKVELYKKMDKDGNGEFNENEKAALDAYNEAIANPDETFQDTSIKDLIAQSGVSSIEKIDLYRQLKQFDIDGDNKLNYAEYQSMLAYLNPPEVKADSSNEDVPPVSVDPTDDPELIAKFDIDGDGELNETEQAALDAYKATLTLEQPNDDDAELIAKFDIDGDGELNAAEQATLNAYKQQKEEAELIAKFDVDGNQVLDAAEQAALEAYKDEKLKEKFDIDGNKILDAAEQAAFNAYKEQKENEKIMAKFDIDGNGVLDAAEQAAMNAYKGAKSTVIPIVPSTTPTQPQTSIPVEDTTAQTSAEMSLLASLQAKLEQLLSMLQKMSLADMVTDAEENIKEKEASKEENTEKPKDSGSSSRSSGKTTKKDTTPSLFDRVLEFKISKQMHELIDTKEIEPDEEVRAELEKEGLDVVEEKFDFNGDKQLDDDERVQHDTYIRQRAQKRVDEKFDINGDKQLDDDETAMRDDYMARVAARHEAEADDGDTPSATEGGDEEDSTANVAEGGDDNSNTPNENSIVDTSDAPTSSASVTIELGSTESSTPQMEDRSYGIDENALKMREDK